VNVRRLGPGDEAVVARLAKKGDPARVEELLADDRTLFFVAFEEDEAIAFVLAYELIRRHGDPSSIFVYEIDVDEPYRRRGVGTALMHAVEGVAGERGISEGFVLTSESNEAAMRFYESLGGVRPNTDDVMWDFAYSRASRPRKP
jgi:ribosomal protein S18 acetylase RimI-like enzyme